MPTFLNRVLLMLAVYNEVADADTCRDSQCNTNCASSGRYPNTGAVAKPGVCYFCWKTGNFENCPDADHRDDGYTYDDCCNEYQCHTCGAGTVAPDPCPCCYQAEPTRPVTGAKKIDGKCFYCWDMDTGGNCPADAEHRSDGYTYDSCCDELSALPQQCSRNDLSEYCTAENLGHVTDGIVDNVVDTVGDAVDNVVDTVSDAVDNAVDTVSDTVDNVVDTVSDAVDVQMFGPNCHLDTCTVVCTLGVNSVEVRLELDVQGTNDGSLKAFLNDAPVLSEAIDGSLACLPLTVSGLADPQICAKVTADQGGGGFTISKSVTVEASLRASFMFGAVTTDPIPFDSYFFEWKCPNLAAIIGVAVGIIAASVFSCILGYFAKKKAKANGAQSKAQSNHIPPVSVGVDVSVGVEVHTDDVPSTSTRLSA